MPVGNRCMLIREMLNECRLSPAEEGIAQYLIEIGEEAAEMKASEVAAACFTTPPAIIRLCHKLGFSGWTEFRAEFAEEARYLRKHFHGIDPNLPFSDQDSAMEIAGKIGTLYRESTDDTLELLNRNELEKAVRILDQAESISVFGISASSFYAENFVFDLRRIGKKVYHSNNSGTILQDCMLMNPKEAALVISYSGETGELRRAVAILSRRKIPYVAITSIGENSVSKDAAAVLHISTREKSVSKIAPYISGVSIRLLLDILYSCIFAADYQNNLKKKFSLNFIEQDHLLRGNSITRDLDAEETQQEIAGSEDGSH